MPAVRTLGLTHLALTVRDAERSAKFYQDVLGCRPTYRETGWIEVQTPGSKDVLVFVEAAGTAQRKAGTMGGVQHFGFRLRRPEDADAAADAIERAGGKVTSRGEFSKGHPFVFAKDPDGYELEIWFE